MQTRQVLERAEPARRNRRGRENTLEVSVEPMREAARWLLAYEPFCETVVLVTFEPKGAHTEMTLRHSGLLDEEMASGHKQGWTWALSMLAERLASR